MNANELKSMLYDEDGCRAELPVGSTLVLRDGTRLLVGDVNKRGGQCDCCNIDYGSIAAVELRATLNEIAIHFFRPDDAGLCANCGLPQSDENHEVPPHMKRANDLKLARNARSVPPQAE